MLIVLWSYERKNSRCAWWENSPSFLGCKSNNLKAFSYIKPSMQRLVEKVQDGSNEMSTPMSSTLKLEKDEDGKSVDQWLYRGMIRFLLYLTASRPDSMFVTCLCARFQSNPKESHLIAYKRIFCYLIGTIGFGLSWFQLDCI